MLLSDPMLHHAHYDDNAGLHANYSLHCCTHAIEGTSYVRNGTSDAQSVHEHLMLQMFPGSCQIRVHSQLYSS